MLTIGKTRIVREREMVRLCADIEVGYRGMTLWFAVDKSQQAYLTRNRADPFVMTLLPGAMRGGHEIVCEDPVSERLHYQLQCNLIPALSSVYGPYHEIRITAPMINDPCENAGAVGTGFSGGVDSLYTVVSHKKGCEYPLTHLAVFNSGVFEGECYRESFQRSCVQAVQFSREHGLHTVFVDTNFYEALPERFLDVYSFRNLACALALQGLFSIYLLSSGHDAGNFRIDVRNAASYDILTASCAGTESLSVYLSGVQLKRWQKLKVLSEWEPSYRWLHPCIYGRAGEKNCGHCKKCARDMTTLYALGALKNYAPVFDIEEYQSNIYARIGFVLANRGNHLYDETLDLLNEKKIPIPPTACMYEKQFRRAIDNSVKIRKKGGEF